MPYAHFCCDVRLCEHDTHVHGYSVQTVRLSTEVTCKVRLIAWICLARAPVGNSYKELIRCNLPMIALVCMSGLVAPS
jgi:hypothetical protein